MGAKVDPVTLNLGTACVPERAGWVCDRAHYTLFRQRLSLEAFPWQWFSSRGISNVGIARQYIGS